MSPGANLFRFAFDYWHTLSLDLWRQSITSLQRSERCYFTFSVGEIGGKTDLSQWLQTLGSSGLRGDTREIKLNRLSHSRAWAETPPAPIVLVPPSLGKQRDTVTNKISSLKGCGVVCMNQKTEIWTTITLNSDIKD